MDFQDFHQSGRFDATSAEAEVMFEHAESGATVGACTEAMNLKAPEGWDRFGHESAVFWDTSAWEKVDGGIASIKTPKWHRGKSERHSVEITWVLLREIATGEVYLRLAGHLPAHLYRLAQRRANLAALRGLRAIVLGLQKDHRPDHATASFDLNRDLRLKHNRRLVEKALKDTGLRLIVPPEGTHGARKIDGLLTDLPHAEAEMLPTAKGFDHRGFTVTLRGGAMRGFMPGALNRNITPGSNDPEIIPAGVVYHVAVSKADSLHDYFDGPSGGIESHFYVRFDGTIEQYRSIFFEADAEYLGNSFALMGRTFGFVSIETEGMGDGKWTPSQIAALKRITLWVRDQSGVPHVCKPFPLDVTPAWNRRGVGYHQMFASWNPHGHTCPGPARIEQFNKILVPWMAVVRNHERKARMNSRGENVDHAVHDLKVAAKRQPKHRAALRKAIDFIKSIAPFTRK